MPPHRTGTWTDLRRRFRRAAVLSRPYARIIAVFVTLTGERTAAQPGAVERNGTNFSIFTTSPERVRLFWLDKNGQPYRQFSNVQSALQQQSKTIEFMMNGGIFEPGGIPSGLLVIDGESLRPLNTAEGKGNFYLKPNGVFYIDADGAHVVSTEEYSHLKPVARLAIQSGPLLVRSGRIHSAFQAGSTNRLHRNGVGVRPDKSILFAITEFGQTRYPNLYEFADFFRAQGCTDALFLDGDISQMVISPKSALTPGNHFGAIFAVTGR